MPIAAENRRVAHKRIWNYIDGAGTLLDWGLQDNHRISESDFDFIRDDFAALYGDWVVVGDALRLAIDSQLTINPEENLLFSPEELAATGHAKER
jgi:hypothetical protein